ncbi:serine/threonine-protein kinase [Nonomuraea gerenzanensis]|uniref:Putative serine/threonine protein kinase n=1 Tax=Nonomuraea gerenzanensis TaxID=93944 RepID=A0A1M4EDN5_9ACTN|nr:serine/threonine-protein kinase [Nonomuraea gerenzanensis]UBU08543.1 serine/threonine protein kinase [Nonomuraea gerenzanensis]SBO96892.1 putative serine/threonine protein kinase [Nonomuraea gerenzanensis]
MSDDIQQIGPYTIIRRLGRGGMGTVYLARLGDSPPVALKVLHPGTDPGFERRFTREVEAARRVARFCTAPVLDAGVDGQTPYLVTEYVDGPDLATAIRDGGPLSGANLEALAVGVATALVAIHQAGIVHRDLKPANILLSSLGPRVIDFGIAQFLTPDATRSAAIVGTPAYMSPEQAAGEPVTAAGDVFAWGGVVVHAATGKAPFGVGGAHEVLYRVVHYAPDLSGLDARLYPLVEQALAKDPARRPTSRQLLDRLLGRESINVAAATDLVSRSWGQRDPAPAPARRRARWVRPVTAIGAALLASAVTAVALLQSGNASPTVSPTVSQTVSPTRTAAVATVTVSSPTHVHATTGLAARDLFVSNSDSRQVPVHVSIDRLVREFDEVRLEWTVENLATGGEQADLFSILGGEGAWDVQGISIRPGRSAKAYHPYVEGEVCQCTYWASYANVINAGGSLQFFAVFRGLPADAAKADLDLLGLGRFDGVPIVEAQ